MFSLGQRSIAAPSRAVGGVGGRCCASWLASGCVGRLRRTGAWFFVRCLFRVRGGGKGQGGRKEGGRKEGGRKEGGRKNKEERTRKKEQGRKTKEERTRKKNQGLKNEERRD